MTGPTDADTAPDTDAAEEFADEIGVDPTQEEIDTYRRLEGTTRPNRPPGSTRPRSAETRSPQGRLTMVWAPSSAPAGAPPEPGSAAPSN